MASSSDLKQPLQDVLVCLDVDLEEELSRFRRSRTGKSPSASRKLGPRFKSQPGLDLITIRPTDQAQSTQTATPASHLTLGMHAAKTDLPTANPPVPSSSSSATKHFTTDHQPLNGNTPRSHTSDPGFEDADLLDDDAIEAPMGDIAALKAQLANTDGTASAADQASTEWALVQTPDSHNGEMEVERHLPAEDYLESSQELLRTSMPETKRRSTPATSGRPSSFQAGLLTPLGIGSMLLLLMSSATLSYVLVNPEVLGRFSRQAEESEIASDSLGSANVGQPQSPDLSSQEFVELDLNTLSTLDNETGVTPQSSDEQPDKAKSETDPKTSTATQAAGDESTNGAPNASGTATKPATAQAGSSTQSLPTKVVTAPIRSNVASSTTAASNQTGTSTSPSPNVAAPTAQPSSSTQEQTALPQIASQSSPSTNTTASGPYYVVSDYTGDQALNKARGVVGDAFVRNFSGGARIQLGAFQDQSRAQELIQELERQGIPARVQSP